MRTRPGVSPLSVTLIACGGLLFAIQRPEDVCPHWGRVLSRDATFPQEAGSRFGDSVSVLLGVGIFVRTEAIAQESSQLTHEAELPHQPGKRGEMSRLVQGEFCPGIDEAQAGD